MPLSDGVLCPSNPSAYAQPRARRRSAQDAITTSASIRGQDSLAEWSKALASGASPKGRGFEPHSCHFSYAHAVRWPCPSFDCAPLPLARANSRDRRPRSVNEAAESWAASIAVGNAIKRKEEGPASNGNAWPRKALQLPPRAARVRGRWAWLAPFAFATVLSLRALCVFAVCSSSLRLFSFGRQHATLKTARLVRFCHHRGQQADAESDSRANAEAPYPNPR